MSAWRSGYFNKFIQGIFISLIIGLWLNTMSKYMYSTANLSDKELKDQGNRLFSLRKYEDAVNCYTKAIVSNNNKIILRLYIIATFTPELVTCKMV